MTPGCPVLYLLKAWPRLCRVLFRHFSHLLSDITRLRHREGVNTFLLTSNTFCCSLFSTQYNSIFYLLPTDLML